MGKFLRYIETEKKLKGIKPTDIYRIGFLSKVFVYNFDCEDTYDKIMQIPGNSDIHPIAFGGSN